MVKIDGVWYHLDGELEDGAPTQDTNGITPIRDHRQTRLLIEPPEVEGQAGSY